MAKYTVTIVTEYQVEIEELTPEARIFIGSWYVPPILPEPYNDANYVDGSITFELVD
jgi:nitrate reductase beta subunit